MSYLFNQYWFCDHDLSSLVQSMDPKIMSTAQNIKKANFLPSTQPQDAQSDSVTKPSGSERKSKSDKNIEILSNYDYQVEQRRGNDADNPITVYICKYKNCNKEFNRTWNMLDHARMHWGIKPYKCKDWEKAFTQKGNLKKHQRQHLNPDLSDRKRYKCQYCDSAYTERYNYKVRIFVYYTWNYSHNIFVAQTLSYRLICGRFTQIEHSLQTFVEVQSKACLSLFTTITYNCRFTTPVN